MTTERTEYFARVTPGDSVSAPCGLVRRRHLEDDQVDEALHGDLTWAPTDAINNLEFLGELGYDLIEIDEPAAERIISGWREKWGPEIAARQARIAARDAATDPKDHWAVLDASTGTQLGLVRRRYLGEDGILDEELCGDGTWAATTGIVDWQRGGRRGEAPVQLLRLGAPDVAASAQQLQDSRRNPSAQAAGEGT